MAGKTLRWFRSRRRLAAVGIVAVLGLLGSACVPPPDELLVPSVAPGTPGSVRTFLYHLNSGPLDPAVEGPRRSVIVLPAWQYQYIAPLKAANPNVKVLVYKDLSSTRDYESAGDELTAGGLNYWTADPSFFLLNAWGQRQAYDGYGGHIVMDVGNVNYQGAFATDVQSELDRFGWDGVFLDNVMWGAPDRIYSVSSPKYGSDWTAAYDWAIVNIGNYIRSHGKLVFANMQEARLRPDLWVSRLRYLDGAMEEFFTGWGTEPLGGWELAAQLELVGLAESMGKTALLRTPTNSVGPAESADYAVASYLLVSDARSAVSHQDTDYGYDAGSTTFWPEYYTYLGAPRGPAANYGDLYVRWFDRGAVVVNGTDSWQSVTLDRAYRAESGAWAATFAVPPRGSEILSG